MAENTIKLAVYGNPPVEIEGVSGSAAPIMPGSIVALATDGLWYPHSTGVFGTFTKPTKVVVENSLAGGDITDSYLQDDLIYMISARPGDVMWLWLALGETTVIGNKLQISGVTSGYLAVAGAEPYSDGQIVGLAMEAVDATASAKRIKVEIS